MNLPTSDQLFAFGRHVGTALASIIGTLAALRIISGGDAAQLQNSIDTISHGSAELITGLSTLAVAVTGLIAALSASPLSQLFRGSKSVLADPSQIASLRMASISDKAGVTAVTDKMPEVAQVTTLPTKAGVELANAVTSDSVTVAA